MVDRSIGLLLFAFSVLGLGGGEARGNGSKEAGIASIYAEEGEKTASGEFARPESLTAAHKTLPFGTRVLITNKANGRMIVVRINDRGPFVKGRVIDVTPKVAEFLGFTERGLTPVELTVVN